jgi:hypothetical protein
MLASKANHLFRKLCLSANHSIDSLIQLKIRKDLVNASSDRLAEIKDRFHGQTVFCIGNGPSLTADQVKLASAHPFVATNRAYQLFDDNAFGIGSKGWLIINDFCRSIEVLPSLGPAYEQVVVGCHDPAKIYLYKSLVRTPWIFANCAWGFRLNSQGIKLLDLSNQQLFSPDFEKRYYAGWSVIFSAIQFAAYLGASHIVLVGCDMNFSGSIQYSSLIKDDRLSIGHLGRFDYQEHGRLHMISCAEGLEAMGVQILNATPGGAINEIPRISYRNLCNLLR